MNDLIAGEYGISSPNDSKTVPIIVEITILYDNHFTRIVGGRNTTGKRGAV